MVEKVICCLSSCVVQKKRLPMKIEKGTGGMNDVDISWIPQETLNVMSKFIFIITTANLLLILRLLSMKMKQHLIFTSCLTDKASPKASPRKRANRAAGTDQ